MTVEERAPFLFRGTVLGRHGREVARFVVRETRKGAERQMINKANVNGKERHYVFSCYP